VYENENDHFQRTLPDYEPGKLSASSAQLLDGEDNGRISRKQAQSHQMRRWIQEQIAEKAYYKEMDREEEMKYAETLRVIGEMRDAAEKEEADMRRAYMDRAHRENQEVLAMSNEIRRKQKAEWDKLTPEEKSRFSSLDLFDENTGKAMDAGGRIIRKDMFKGFTDAQRRRIFQENEAVIQQKRDREQGHLDGNAEWNLQQIAISRALDMAHLDEELMRKMELDRHLGVLSAQQEQERQRKAQEKVDRFGSISGQFFSNFGTSAR